MYYWENKDQRTEYDRQEMKAKDENREQITENKKRGEVICDADIKLVLK